MVKQAGDRCFRVGCGNPVVVASKDRDPGDLPACGKHGGETKPTFVVYNRDVPGWLTDTGVGGSYSTDVDDAQWFEGEEDVIQTLIATDILDARDRWRVVQGMPFVVARIK